MSETGRKTKRITYNLHERGRSHLGKDRSNVDMNEMIRQINSPQVQEMVKTGTLYGYSKDAVVDTRRIRQENIELLARSKATIEAPSIELKGETKITGNEQVTGNVIVGSGATGIFSNVFGKTLTIADGIVIQIS